MKAAVYFGLLLSFALTAKAEILTCVFPEPHLSVNYNGAMAQVALMKAGQQPQDAGIIVNTQMYITGHDQYEVQTIDGQKILSIKLTEKATLPGSRDIYPFEAVYTFPFPAEKASKDDAALLKTQIGVCESTVIKKKSVK